MIALKRILVATDFSEASHAAVRYGLALAQRFDARLHLLHAAGRQDVQVMVERQRVIDEFLRDPDEPAVRHNAARELMADFLTGHDGTAAPAECVLRASGPGGAYVEIVRYASEREIDLIIVGTHGRGFIGHMFMGSVAEKVVRNAPCPVLTVHHPQHEFVLP